jgi:hypothetical protein
MSFGPGLIAETMLFRAVGNLAPRRAVGNAMQPADRSPTLVDH